MNTYTNQLIDEFNKYPNVDFIEAKRLIRNGADINYKNVDGETFLFDATYLEQQSIFDFLINNGADVNLGNNQNAVPLSCAVDRNNEYMIMKLVQHGADFNIADVDGNTPFLESIVENSILFDYCINNGADVNYANSIGFTPLMCASFVGSLSAMQALLEKGANVNARSAAGMTPIMYAVNGIVDVNVLSNIIKILINNGADVNIQDSNGITVMMYTCLHANVHHDTDEQLMLLFMSLINSMNVNFSLRDNNGQDIFGYLFEINRENVIYDIANYVSQMKVLYVNHLLGPEGIGMNPNNDFIGDLYNYAKKRSGGSSYKKIKKTCKQ